MTTAMSLLLARLEAIQARYTELENLLARPDIATDYEEAQKLAKERASLEEVVTLYQQYQETVRSLEETQEMLRDPELGEMARGEVESLEAQRTELEHRLRLALLPKDPNDERNVIMEIRAGAGGDEAALFAGDLFEMYSRYAENHNWKVEVLDSHPTGTSGFKEIIFEVRGQGAFSRLKHERGVHRVQRVPVTEASGRIHTSTSTVAVLPEAEEVDVDISPDDLRVDIFHAGGHGGQNVNKVATAIRITHLPSGMVVVCQDERSQHRNRAKAMAVLRSRLLDIETRRQQEETAADRRSQVGTGERSEKVRTYNFPQNRVSDHRINLTTHNLDRVLNGDLDQFIEALQAAEQAEKLQETAA